jgi:hypothetical protein
MAVLLKAMIAFRLGDVEKAATDSRAIEQGWIVYPSLERGQLLYPSDWHDGIGAELLHREAKQLFQSRNGTDASPSDQITPADPVTTDSR